MPILESEQDENKDIRSQLDEANSVLHAIRNGEVDALLVSHNHRDQVYILKGADHVYRVLVEEMQEGYLTVDEAGNIMFCNKKFAELVDTPHNVIIGHQVSSYFSSLDISEISQSLNTKERRCKIEACLLACSNKSIPVLISAAHITVDNDKVTCMVITDLTEQKRRERLTNLVLEQASEAILVCNSHGKIVKANLTATKLFGNQVIYQNFNEAIIFVKDNGQAIKIDDLLEGHPIRGLEVSSRINGMLCYFLLSAARLFDKDDGQNFGAVFTLTDITNRRKLEQEMGRLDRLNLIGEMAAGIGHEVRNPMTTVRGFLQSFFHKEEFKNHRSSLDLMIEELDRANQIITEFLSLAKNKSIERVPVNISEVVNHVMPLLLSDANRRGHEIIFKEGPVRRVLVDQKEMRQCLLNLTRNGLEAMGNRGTLIIETKEMENKVILQVIDQGQGIAQEMIDKLGTPFLTTKDNGTGLGLAICYSIAERNNAELTVKTGPEGTTFSLLLNPCDEERSSA